MMRIARQIAPLYPQLNLDLLIAGILFHDSGKLWENHLPETGFTMGFDERGELMGHISIGMELVNSTLAEGSLACGERRRGANCSRRPRMCGCTCCT